MLAQNIGINISVVVFCTSAVLVSLGVFYLLWRLATVRERRRSCERLVVGSVATVLDQQIPLAEGLRAAAASEADLVSYRLGNLALATERGEQFAATLRADFPECSGMVYSLAKAGEAAQQLPGAMALAERALVERDRRETFIGRGAAAYVIVVLTAIVLLLAMILVIIIPKYEEIFVDFDTELPALTVWLIGFSQAAARSLVFGAAIGFILFASVCFLRWRERRPDDPRWTSRWADTVRWVVPGLHTLQRNEGLALAFRVMRLVVEAQQPLADAARHAAQLDVNLYLRDLLGDFAARLERGADPGEAARGSGLGNITAVALSAGMRAGNLPAALRYAADYHEALVSRWWVFLRQISWPVCTMILATMVATVVLAMFMPLVTLINSVEIW